MQNEVNWIKGVVAVIGGIAAYLWGPWDALIITLVTFVALDYITGVIKAGVLKKLDSAVGFRGLLKKLFIFAMVALATVIDRIVPAANNAIRSAVMLFYIANEGLSIIENAGEMGLPVPKILKAAIASLKKNSGEEDESNSTPSDSDTNDSNNDAQG